MNTSTYIKSVMDNATTAYYVVKSFLLFWTKKVINAIIPIKKVSSSQNKKYLLFLYLLRANMLYHMYNLFGGFYINNNMIKTTLLLSSNNKHFITTIKSCEMKQFYSTLKCLETDELKYERVLCSPTIKKIEIITNNVAIDITDHVKNIINHDDNVLFEELLDLLLLPKYSELVVHKFNFETFQLCQYLFNTAEFFELPVNDVLKKVEIIP